HLQEALLRLAPLPVMDACQADERIGRTAWVELAAWLRAHDFLYEALDGGRFRLNPMVRSFLCDEYQRLEPAAFDDTLGDLIETLAHEGRTSEAIELARHDGQERRLADVLEASAQGCSTAALSPSSGVVSNRCRYRCSKRGQFWRECARGCSCTWAARRMRSKRPTGSSPTRHSRARRGCTRYSRR